MIQKDYTPEFGEIRTVEVNGEPWLVGKDVATVLGYSDTDKAVRNHVDEEDKLTRQFGGSGQNRNMTVINESGLYSVILRSDKPEAKPFRKWATSGGRISEKNLIKPDIWRVANCPELRRNREENGTEKWKDQRIKTESKTNQKTAEKISESLPAVVAEPDLAEHRKKPTQTKPVQKPYKRQRKISGTLSARAKPKQKRSKKRRKNFLMDCLTAQNQHKISTKNGNFFAYEEMPDMRRKYPCLRQPGAGGWCDCPKAPVHQMWSRV